MVQIRRQPAPESVPAMPPRENLVALVVVICFLVFGFWSGARVAHIERRTNHRIQNVVGVNRISCPIGENGASDGIAELLSMRCQLHV